MTCIGGRGFCILGETFARILAEHRIDDVKIQKGSTWLYVKQVGFICKFQFARFAPKEKIKGCKFGLL